LPLPAGAATETTIAALLTAAQAIKTAAETLAGRTLNTAAIAGTVALDASSLAALETISVANFPGTQPVSGPLTDAQLRAASVPVAITSGTGLTDAQLRAAAVPVSGTFFPGTQPVSGTVAVSNFTDAGLTDAQLRASALSVNDVNMAAVTKQKNSASSVADFGQILLAQRRDSDTAETTADGQYTALKQDEAGRLKVSTQPGSFAADVGTITAASGVRVMNVERASNITISLVATALSGHNATFEYSNNSTNGTDGNWYGVQVVRSNANTVDTTTGVLSATPVYGWEASVNAYRWFRVRATAHTSGTATYTLLPGCYATEPIPAMQVTGTQPVSGTVTATVTNGTVISTPATPTALNISSLATTNASVVKASAGTLYNISASNTGAAAAFLKLFNLAVAPTVGTSVPVLTVVIPAGSTIDHDLGILGHRFVTGIAVSITNLAADADTTAIAAAQVKVLASFI
jgi:hypothetical protein